MIPFWRVRALVKTEGGWQEQISEPSSYTDALELRWKLLDAGAREIQFIESSGPLAPNGAAAPPADQLELFKGGPR